MRGSPRTTELILGRTHHALDNLPGSAGALGTGTGHRCHAEWIHPHSAGGGCRRGADPDHPGAKADLTSDHATGVGRLNPQWCGGGPCGSGPKVGAIITNQPSRGWVLPRLPGVPKTDWRNRLATGNLAGGDEGGPAECFDLGLRHPSARAVGCEQVKTLHWRVSPPGGSGIDDGTAVRE
jgi:hypothetical protein